MKKLFLLSTLIVSITSTANNSKKDLGALSADLFRSKFAADVKHKCTLTSYFQSQDARAKEETKLKSSKKPFNTALLAQLKDSISMYPEDLQDLTEIVSNTDLFVDAKDATSKKDLQAIQNATALLVETLKATSNKAMLEESLSKIGTQLERVAAAGKKLKGSLFASIKSKLSTKKADVTPHLKKLKDMLSKRIKELVDSYNMLIKLDTNTFNKLKKISF
jgi:hypothetical protein